ncbi:TonB-dependent hemoglobin/transferrin/lactoferrin family receptor [Avibacterium gallinarum]|uniref:TonB-dependent hemoglobin/transferrin/lactoferrin family receptor n=1 Tax=Avibacterium gallinarum TaxID=755 RepID=UPI0039FDAF4E
MEMKFSPLYLALASTICTTICSTAYAAEQLEQINVQALRDPTQYTKDQANIAILNRSQLDTLQPASVVEALSTQANVEIAGGSRTLAKKPAIRGLSGTRVVQVVDGVRQNFNLEHRGSYFLPTSMLSEVEVVKGPASTLWGSGALGGVVAMRTLNAFDLLRPNETWGALIKQGYHSADSGSQSELAVYGANGQFDWLIQGFYNKNKDLRLGKDLGKLPHSELTQQGGLVKAGWQINDHHRLELNLRGTQSKQTAPANNEMYESYTPNDFVAEVGKIYASGGKPDYGKAGGIADLSSQKVKDRSASLRYLFNPDSQLVNGELTLYINDTKETETNLRTGTNDETHYKTTGFNLRNASEFERVALIYGVDFYQDRVKTKREKKAQDGTCINASSPRCRDYSTANYRPNPYDAKANVWGAYLLSHINLSDNLVLSPALRFDSYQSSEKQSQSYRKNHLSPSVTLDYRAAPWLNLSAKYAEAFRAPSLQERYISGHHFGFKGMAEAVFVENTDLKAEVAKNKELSAKFHWQDLWTVQDKFSVTATVFQNDVKDFIELQQIGMQRRTLLFQYRNVQNARLRGAELAAHYETPRWSTDLQYGVLRGKDRQTGEALENINADKIVLAASYALVPETFTVGAKVRHYFAQKRVPTSHNGHYPSYTLTDITASYAPQKGEWSNLRIDFAVENLFDKAYTPAFSLTPEAGRNVKVSLAYQF